MSFTPGDAGLRRRLADLVCRALQAMLPPALQSWGWAIRCETSGIANDTTALLFAIHSLCGLIPQAIASHLSQSFNSRVGDGDPFAGGSTAMNINDAMTRRPRTIGIACAIGAVILGLTYMAVAGAPGRYLAINAGALAIGLTLLALLGQIQTAGRQVIGAAIAAMAAALLATALLGARADGAARWVSLGGLAIQPSAILVPLMLVAFSRARSVLATAGIVAAAAAVALQPDRAMAGILALGLAALAATSRDRHVMAALVAGIGAFGATMVRADTLIAVPYVDQILYSSFDVHAGAGLAIWIGLALLLIPAIIGWRRDADNRATYAVFGAVWFATIVAAALGNYPTPVVGYGGSAIIGYALSLVGLPRRCGAISETVRQARTEVAATLPDRHLRVGMV